MVEKENAGNLLSYKKGKPPKKDRSESYNELPYLTPEYLRGNEKPEIYPVNNNSIIVKNDDILLLWDGSNAGEFFKAKKGILASTMVVLNFSSELIKDYAFYAFKMFEPYLKGQTSGSGIPHVDKEILRNLEINIFEEKEQVKIAKILTKIDETIKQTEKVIDKHERIKEGMMQDLFSKGIDEKGNIRSEETHKFKDSPIGKIPEDWDVKQIDDITSFVGSGITPRGGSQVYLKDGVPLIRSQNVYDDGIKFEGMAYISGKIDKMMKRTRVLNNDILLNITGASLGRCCPVPIGFPSSNVNQHVCIIRLENQNYEDSYYVSKFLSSSKGQKQIFNLNAGSNREGLNFQQIRKIIIPYPIKKEREQIFKALEKAYSTIRINKIELIKLNHLKAGLMQDLLTGKVRVNHLIERESLNEKQNT